MFKATKEIYDVLSGVEGLKPQIEETEKSSRVWLQFNLQNGGNYKISMINTDDDNDVAVRVFSLARITEEQKPRILELLNELNYTYRFIRFYCDKDGDINIAYDFLTTVSDPTESMKELVVRITQIVKDVYPQIMRTIWA